MNAASQLSITNFSARNACQRSGMAGEIARSHLREKLLTLETLERTALSAATEAEKAINNIAFWEHTIVVSKVTQICADWFIKLASEAVPLGGKWISPAYDGTKNVVATLNGTFTPLKLLKETSKTIVKGVTEFAKESQHGSCARGLKLAGTLTKAVGDIYDLHSVFSRIVDNGGFSDARATALKWVEQIRSQIAMLKDVIAAYNTSPSPCVWPPLRFP